ncbi:GyrI-like domain-containing protein [Butyrivibrio fibrisolvens]|uniref:GyrI-like domain-containing protein n=1 Tax=Butyrivibrio fibrisolvens TaxID=831 RepID=UPI0011148859
MPKATYAVFETKDIDKPIDDYEKLIRQRIDIVTEWMPSLGFELADAQELAVYHSTPKSERCVQIWLPIKKR